MTIASSDFELPVFASLLNQPELMSDMEEAGSVICCLILYATRVASAATNYTQYVSLPLFTELFPQWNILVECSRLLPSTKAILREERIENITIEMYDLAEGFKDLARFSHIVLTEDSLHNVVALTMMEVVWEVFGITNQEDERVGELLETLNLPSSIMERALDSIFQPVVDDSSDDDTPHCEYEIMVQDVPENAETYCWICYGEMSEAVAMDPCGHCFCGPCILEWVNEGVGATTDCPMCRVRIVA